MKTRHKKGYIYKKGGSWYVRCYDFGTKKDGTTGRVQIARRVAPVCDQNRSKKSVLR